ncbi:MAG: cytochrome c oxidase subunit II [Pseudomonadota bacterium]
MRLGKIAPAALAVAASAPAALAQSSERIVGAPVQGGVNMQPAATELAVDLHWLDNFLLVIITAITVFVMVLMAYVILRFRKSANPRPATFTHNSLVEVVWTVGPILILVAIAIPSLQLLAKQTTIPEADLTIKATGNQWFWTYEYPDHEIIFDAYMVGYGYKDFDTAMAEAGDELEEYGVTRDTWLLQTTTEVVVPVGEVVRLQVTASDVIHSWTIPAFGVKMDGIPGRLNETWFQVDEPGVYYGQCSELCGKDHSYMPIAVRAVPREEYDAWLEQAIEMYAGKPAAVTVASAQ